MRRNPAEVVQHDAFLKTLGRLTQRIVVGDDSAQRKPALVDCAHLAGRIAD